MSKIPSAITSNVILVPLKTSPVSRGMTSVRVSRQLLYDRHIHGVITHKCKAGVSVCDCSALISPQRLFPQLACYPTPPLSCLFLQPNAHLFCIQIFRVISRQLWENFCTLNMYGQIFLWFCTDAVLLIRYDTMTLRIFFSKTCYEYNILAFVKRYVSLTNLNNIHDLL